MIAGAGGSGPLILAAGAGSRFGAPKALAPLDGRPLLEHVLGAVARDRPGGRRRRRSETGRTTSPRRSTWSGERRVVEPGPPIVACRARSRSGSRRSRTGSAGTSSTGSSSCWATSRSSIRRSSARWSRPRSAPGPRSSAPRYHAGGDEPGARPAARAAVDRRGDGRPGSRTDPGRPSGARRGGRGRWRQSRRRHARRPRRRELAWAERVRGNREQVDRLREVPDGADFYGPVTSLFRADPRRTDDPVLDALLALAEPADTLARHRRRCGPLRAAARAVACARSSRSSRRRRCWTALVELAAEHGITGVRVIDERWPPPAGSVAATVRADVALIAHLGYDVEAIGPFLDAMEAAARRLCVAVLMDRQPSSIADPFWPPIHGEERIRLPALDALVDLLAARGRAPSVARFDRAPRRFASFDDRPWVRPPPALAGRGRREGRQLAGLLRATAEERDGTWSVTPGPQTIGVASWRPDGA